MVVGTTPGNSQPIGKIWKISGRSCQAETNPMTSYDKQHVVVKCCEGWNADDLLQPLPHHDFRCWALKFCSKLGALKSTEFNTAADHCCWRLRWPHQTTQLCDTSIQFQSSPERPYPRCRVVWVSNWPQMYPNVPITHSMGVGMHSTSSRKWHEMARSAVLASQSAQSAESAESTESSYPLVN